METGTTPTKGNDLMKKLTLTAIKTFMYATTFCIIPLCIASGYEIFREKSVIHPIDTTPCMLICIIACVNAMLSCYIKKHEAKETIIMN
jgi:hypothetical protein